SARRPGARTAGGSGAACDSATPPSISRGSCRYPSLHSRHIDDNAGGRSSSMPPPRVPRFGEPGFVRLGEDVKRHALLLVAGESLRLQIEHRSIAAVFRHELVV